MMLVKSRDGKNLTQQAFTQSLALSPQHFLWQDVKGK